ncbi:MAG: metallophosphoesterase family protein [Thermoprotei archaeon]
MSRVLVILALAIIFYMVLGSTEIITSDNGDIVPLYDKTRRIIPNTLPWYPILVFGDNRPENTGSAKYNPVFYRMIREFDEIYPIAVIGSGDHVGIGYEYQYVELYKVFNETRLENIWLAIGNHDVDVSEGWDNWAKYIGPEYYYIDDIPGWRIGIVNTETRLTMYWERQLRSMYENISNRSLVLVFHRPVYPDLDHNIRSDWIPITLNIFRELGFPKIVLQGHWHGWAYEVRYNTTWIVTGGAGAPLYTYEVPQPENGEVVIGVYHYTVLILYPNQTFRFYPVSILNGTLSVNKINDTAYLVTNTKLDVHGNPVEIPVRIKYEYNNYDVYVALMATPMENTIVVFKPLNETHLLITCNSTDWYAYAYNTMDPDNSPVYIPRDNTTIVDLSQLLQLQTTTQTPQTTVSIPPSTTTTTATTTPTTRISYTTTTQTTKTTTPTTIPTTTSPTRTETTPTTSTPISIAKSETTEEHETKEYEGISINPYILAGSVFLIIAIGTIVWYYFVRK